MTRTASTISDRSRFAARRCSDYYDVDLEHGSEDPADAAITTRILTLMLVEEY